MEKDSQPQINFFFFSFNLRSKPNLVLSRVVRLEVWRGRE